MMGGGHSFPHFPVHPSPHGADPPPGVSPPSVGGISPQQSGKGQGRAPLALSRGGGRSRLAATAAAHQALLSDSSNSAEEGTAPLKSGGLQVGTAQYAAAVRRAAALLDDTPVKGGRGGATDENYPPAFSQFTRQGDGPLQAAARRLGVAWTSDSSGGSVTGEGWGAEGGGAPRDGRVQFGTPLSRAVARGQLLGTASGSDADSSW